MCGVGFLSKPPVGRTSVGGLMIQTAIATLVAALMLSLSTSYAASYAAPGTDPIRIGGGGSGVSATFKVPSRLRANMPIPKAVKTFLDRDFRSRYPVAAPIKVDVVDAWVDLYNVGSIPDGYGGFDSRHYFRVIARHASGALVFLDISIYERMDVQPDQDRLLLEGFRVVGWQP